MLSTSARMKNVRRAPKLTTEILPAWTAATPGLSGSAVVFCVVLVADVLELFKQFRVVDIQGTGGAAFDVQSVDPLGQVVIHAVDVQGSFAGALSLAGTDDVQAVQVHDRVKDPDAGPGAGCVVNP